MTKQDQGDFAAFDFEKHEAITDRWLIIGDIVRRIAARPIVEQQLIAACLYDVVFDDPDEARVDWASLPWAEARRGYKRPVLTREEQRRANSITFEDDSESRIAALWWELSPASQARLRRAIGGGK